MAKIKFTSLTITDESGKELAVVNTESLLSIPKGNVNMEPMRYESEGFLLAMAEWNSQEFRN